MKSFIYFTSSKCHFYQVFEARTYLSALYLKRYCTPEKACNLFFQLIKPNSRLDQKFCQLFFHCDAIVDKLSKLGQISCVISYYMEIKDSLYLSKFFVNVLKNWCTKWERLTLCKIFDGKCEKGTPLTSLSQILQSIFKVTYRNPATIESSKLETIYIFLRSKIWSSVVFWEFGNSTILVTS